MVFTGAGGYHAFCVVKSTLRDIRNDVDRRLEDNNKDINQVLSNLDQVKMDIHRLNLDMNNNHLNTEHLSKRVSSIENKNMDIEGKLSTISEKMVGLEVLIKNK